MTCILVTGATGFLGSNLIDRLSALGADVLASGRDPTACRKLQDAGYPIFRHDLTVPFDRSSHSKLCEVDAIVHCAALPSPFGPFRDFFSANVTATKNLVEFARYQNVRRLIYISTPTVYFAFRDQLDVGEDAKLPPPVNHYARTKGLAERVVLAEQEIRPVILRPRGIYGRGDRALLPRLLHVARTRPLPLFRDGKACIDLTYVDDVVDAIIAALEAGQDVEGETFNISGGEVLPVRDIADRACACAGIATQWKRAALAPAMIAAATAEKVAGLLPGCWEPPVTRYALGLFAYAQSLNTAKAQRILRWAPKTPFDAGLHYTFQKQKAS